MVGVRSPVGYRGPALYVYRLLQRLTGVKPRQRRTAILVENHNFPIARILLPPAPKKGTLGIGYRCWRSKLQMLGQSGRNEI